MDSARVSRDSGVARGEIYRLFKEGGKGHVPFLPVLCVQNKLFARFQLGFCECVACIDAPGRSRGGHRSWL
jgi:hypothetical protein